MTPTPSRRASFTPQDLARQVRIGRRRQAEAAAEIAGALRLARATLSPAEFRQLLVAELGRGPSGRKATRQNCACRAIAPSLDR